MIPTFIRPLLASDGTPIELLQGEIIPDAYPVSEIILKFANGRTDTSIALALGMPVELFNEWMDCGAPLNANFAGRLAEWSGTTSGYWFGVQRDYIEKLANNGTFL